jgi:hypothetical protein
LHRIAEIRPDKDFEIPRPIVGWIDSFYDTPERATSDAGPAYELNRRPTIELESYVISYMDQGLIQTTDVEFDPQVIGIGDKFKEFVLRIDGHTELD